MQPNNNIQTPSLIESVYLGTGKALQQVVSSAIDRLVPELTKAFTAAVELGLEKRVNYPALELNGGLGTATLTSGQSQILCDVIERKPGNTTTFGVHVDVDVANQAAINSPIIVRLQIVGGAGKGARTTATEISVGRGTSFNITGQTLRILAINDGTVPVTVSITVGPTSIAAIDNPRRNFDVSLTAADAGNTGIVTLSLDHTIPKYASAIYVQRMPYTNPICIEQRTDTKAGSGVITSQDVTAASTTMAAPVFLNPLTRFILIGQAAAAGGTTGGPAFTRLNVTYTINI